MRRPSLTARRLAASAALLLGWVGLPLGNPPFPLLGTASAQVAADVTNPHAAHGSTGPSRAAELFDAPPNLAEDDASLPAGTLLVQLLDARGLPVPETPLRLITARSSVMKGDSQSQRVSKSDAAGLLRFEGLERGAQLRYTVEASRGGGTFSLPAFALGTEAGKKVTLHVYESTEELGRALVGLQGMTYLSLKEGVVQVEQVWSVFNVGAVAWIARDLLVPLPEGAKGLKVDESEGGLSLETVSGKGVALRGTASPGRHDLAFRYQLPLEDEERQSFRLPNPPRMAQQQIVAEASTQMGLEVRGFPAAERTQSRDGRRVLVTQKQASQMVGLSETLVTLTGLPTPSPARWIAAGLAAALVMGALAQRRRQEAEERQGAKARAEREAELAQARASLLDEVVALEKAHREGSVGPKTYERVRRALVDALARLETQLTQLGEGAGPTGR